MAGARELWKNGINSTNRMVDAMIDRDGYRPNVAIVLVNSRNQVFWGKRIKEHAWQFPQGGIKPGESPEEAMYRELNEETGLAPQHVGQALAHAGSLPRQRDRGSTRAASSLVVRTDARLG